MNDARVAESMGHHPSIYTFRKKKNEHRAVNCHFTEMQDSLSGRNNKQEREEGKDAARERAQREVMPLISQSLQNSDGLETTLLERTLSWMLPSHCKSIISTSECHCHISRPLSSHIYR